MEVAMLVGLACGVLGCMLLYIIAADLDAIRKIMERRNG